MKIFTSVILLLSLNGCATINSIDSANPGSPVFFSGTRLNAAALQDNKMTLNKFKTEPPESPLLDLPFSFVADLFISPLTGSVAFYEVMFE